MIPYKVVNFLQMFSDDIDGIIHVGAHLGQEVKDYRKFNLNKIILFEPQKEIFNRLASNVKGLNNVVCYNFGLGAKNEKKVLYKSKENNGLSSSVLYPELHLSVQPKISFDDSEEIEIKRFDSLEIDSLKFLAIDVQGFELEVLKGFGKELEKVEFIFTEINTKYLYRNNVLVSDIDRYLKEFNFERIYTNLDCFNYYGDALYIKTTNKKYKKNFIKKLINRIVISNYYLHLKKITEPKKLLKIIFNE